jgi:hypothetical protein
MCPPSAEWVGGTYTFGSITKSSPLTAETDPVSERLCSLEFWTMDEVQKHSNPDYYIRESDPFRIDIIPCLKLYLHDTLTFTSNGTISR